MRKTWFTKVLVALMTLAMVAGVFVTAPKDALADNTITDSGSNTKTVAAGVALSLNPTYNPDTVIADECNFAWTADSGMAVNGQGVSNGNPWASVSSTTPKKSYAVTVVATKKADSTEVARLAYTIEVTRPPITATVGASVTTLSAGEKITFTASPSGSGYTYEWPSAATSLESPSGGSSNTITFTAAQVAADTSGTVNCTVKWSDAPGVKNTGTSPQYTVKAASLSATSGELSIGNSIDLNSLIQYKGNRTVSYAIASGSDYVTLSGSTVTAKKAGSASVTVTVQGQSNLNYDINVTQSTPTLNFGSNSTTNPQKFKNSGSLNIASVLNTNVPADQISWSMSGIGTLSGTTYSAPSSGTGSAAITATVNGGGDYSYASATFYATIVGDYVISGVPSGTQRLTNVNDTQTFTPSVTVGGGTITATSSNETVATVSDNGTTFTVLGRSVGTATIRVSATNSSDSKSFTVVVGNPTPSINKTDTHYSSNGSGYTDRLNKTYPWMGLHIQVNNAAGGYYYAEVTRSNIRTYIPSNYYSSHPSTYVYRVALDANGFGETRIQAQYNGKTYYTIRVRDANGNVVDTYQLGEITVSGYTTMPQTGPDYTWVYVLGGLCVAALAAAVTLNARKKKQQES